MQGLCGDSLINYSDVFSTNSRSDDGTSHVNRRNGRGACKRGNTYFVGEQDAELPQRSRGSLHAALRAGK